MGGGAWWAAVHGVAKSRTRPSDLTFTFHALEQEMATHSSVLAWRIPGTQEPGGLPSMGSHRVGHDWSDLAAAEMLQLHFAAFLVHKILHFLMILGLLSHSSNLDGPGKCEVITENSTITPFLCPRSSSSTQSSYISEPWLCNGKLYISSSEVKTMNSQLSVWGLYVSSPWY